MAGGIEEPDPDERRRARHVHRIGSALFLIIILGALVGLLGKGPLSKTAAESTDSPLRVEYFRFLHYQEPAELRIAAAPEASSNGTLRIRLSKTFVDAVEIERIDPEPESEEAGEKFFTYTLRVQTNAATEVRVRFDASQFGRQKYEVGLAEGALLHLWHFAFP